MSIPEKELKKYNTLIYQLDGELTINDKDQTKAKDLIWFDNDGKEEINISATKNRAQYY